MSVYVGKNALLYYWVVCLLSNLFFIIWASVWETRSSNYSPVFTSCSYLNPYIITDEVANTVVMKELEGAFLPFRI